MNVYLAPMEGLTTYIFRTAWNRYYGGMDKYFTPFLASRRLSSRDKNDVMPEHNVGMETVPQILTNKSDEFIEIATTLQEYGYREVNLNLGCPSGTVVSKKRGAGFLGVPEDLETFLDEIFEGCPVPISIKTRIGQKDVREWSHLLEIFAKYPIKELTIHPRLQVEGYQGTPHLEAYEMAENQLTCPLCYNGDITSVADYERIQEAFPNLTSVMIGRGILQNPGLLNRIKENPVKPEEALGTLKSFHDEILAGYEGIMSGDTNVLYKMKDLWTFLGKSFHSPEAYVKKIRKSSNLVEYRLAVQTIFRECPLQWSEK